MKKIFLILASLVIFISFLAGCASPSASSSAPASEPRLRVATTTSLYDTGLWSRLEPLFEERYGVALDVIYAGTGRAIELAKNGDVAVITIHSRSREEAFVADGYGIERVPFAYNYFLIVGPPSDPAGIRGMLPEEAFRKLIETGAASFVSRGDDSGTHGKEKSIWAAAGYDYETVRQSGAWYLEAGAGMGSTLTLASEKEAYTLSDMATYLAYQGDIDLVPVIDRGGMLLNVYSAIAVNPEKVAVANPEMALKLVEFLTSPQIQKLIGEYGVGEYGMPLFLPCAGNEPTE